jgi:hypothetical protein
MAHYTKLIEEILTKVPTNDEQAVALNALLGYCRNKDRK